MNLVKGLRRCVRLLKHRISTKIIHDRQIGAMSVEQRRHFRYDDRFNWPTGNPGDSKVYAEEGFDPRYDERHFKSYQRNDGSGPNSGWSGSVKDPESRRRITQDTMDHQRRQERIIQENKWRWQHRSEPKTGVHYFEKPIYGAGPPGKRNSPGEQRVVRKGREQRQKEVKRQERELRESRKNYNLPGYNRPLKSEAEAEADEAPVAEQPSTQYASRAWLEKQAREDEQQYWHTWNTCPTERQNTETAEDDSEEVMHGYESPRGTRRGFVKPPQPYDGGVRRFQTHSAQLTDRQLPYVEPPRYVQGKRAAIRRKPSGMEKQYLLARDFTRANRISDESDVTLDDLNNGFKRPSSLLQSHVFRSSPMAYAGTQEDQQLEDIELPKQPPRMKLAWQGLPRPIYKRFDGIKRAVDRKNQDRIKQRLQPPRFRMTVKSRGMRRQRTPIDCFSDQLAIDTRYTPHSEYLGYGRQSVCDAWQKFTNGHNLKPIY